MQVWARQKYSGDYKRWHKMAADGRTMLCNRNQKIKVGRSEFSKSPPTVGKICKKCEQTSC